jgi:pheromone a factor receptor
VSLFSHSLSESCLQCCNPEYVVSANRYDIFEDFGPIISTYCSWPAFVLFYTWPVLIGCVSLFYCGEYPGLHLPSGALGSLVPVVNIYTFFRRDRELSEFRSTCRGLSRGRYRRLMAIGAAELLGTIPLGTYYIVHDVRIGVLPWISWAYTHGNYSAVRQVPAFIWRYDPNIGAGLEGFRWLLVASAFIFFALFGFAEEARQNYRRIYTTLASRIGFSTFTLRESSQAYVSLCWSVQTHFRAHFFFFFFLQYFVSTSLEEQGRRHCLCRHNDWRQAQIERLVRRPIFDSVHFHRR